MSKKYMETAAREGRLAVLPRFLQPGRTVWFWRESLCDEDACLDLVSSICPMNSGAVWNDPTTRLCARRHPVLDSCVVSEVLVSFTWKGRTYMVNDNPPVAEEFLRGAYFPSREEAEAHRPAEVISLGG